jgi:hypothetical protein
MSDYDGTILFKEWLPDLPDLNNPGMTQAQNVIPMSGGYASYAPLSTTLNALGSNVRHAMRASDGSGDWLYVGISNASAGALYRGSASAGSWSLVSASTFAATGIWDMVQYEGEVIATNGGDLPVYQSLGSASNFATLGSTVGTAPEARKIGVIGQFIVLGNIPLSSTQYAVRWSGIDSPHSYPTPGSDTAIAMQSGEQLLPAELGAVTGIFGGDQFGLVFQSGGITRMTYIGGGAVFQFETIDKGNGCAFLNGAVKVGTLVYFVSAKGFFVTDGVQVVPIGSGKVNEYFLSRVDFSLATNVIAGVDWRRKLILWTFPAVADSGNPSSALVYHYEEKRWSLVVDTIRFFVRGTEAKFQTYGLEAFGNDNKLGRFTGTPGNAVIATAELEPNPGGFACEFGIKPLVDQANVTVAMRTRDTQSAALTTTAEITANARSGFSNFRAEARYHRARLTIAGTFNAAQGVEYQASAAGYT